MIFTIKTNNFLITNLENTQLIIMPSKLTSNEVGLFKQLILETAESSKAINLNCSDSGVNKIVLDFRKTTFIHNDGLIGLCQIFQIAKEKKIDLVFKSFSPQVKMVLALSGLENVFLAKNKTALSPLS